MPSKDTDLANDPTLIGNSQPRHDKIPPPEHAGRMTKSGRQTIPGGDVSEPAHENLEPPDFEDLDAQEKKRP